MNAWVTPLTNSNDSSIAACTSAHLRNNVPIGYNGTPQEWVSGHISTIQCHKSHPKYTPQIHPKTAPSPSPITTHLILLSFDWLHSPPQTKRHPDPISCFATIHFADRHTDRPTDRQMVQANVPSNERSTCYADREWRTNNRLIHLYQAFCTVIS